LLCLEDVPLGMQGRMWLPGLTWTHFCREEMGRKRWTNGFASSVTWLKPIRSISVEFHELQSASQW